MRALEFDILFGNLKPRERLVEDALMQRFSAKRHTVRQALVELERMGIVTRTPNRGAAVRDFAAEEVEEIAEVRATLHRRAAQRMKLPAGAALIAKLEALQRRHDKAVAARDPRCHRRGERGVPQRPIRRLRQPALGAGHHPLFLPIARHAPLSAGRSGVAAALHASTGR